MTENNNTTFCVEKSLSSRVQQFHKNLHKQMTFYEILENVEEQIQIDCFSGSDLENAKEIALIIAEVIKLPDSAKVRISGNDISAEMVSDVYDMLEHENVCEVIRRYKEATYEIKHIKTYLRTALYNSVFEKNARIENEVNKDMCDDKEKLKCKGKNKRYQARCWK